MKQHINTRRPAPQPNRERIFSMRMTGAERKAIEILAQHFTLEAVNFYSQ